MFLINKSITFMLSTKRNAKNYTINPPRCTILFISRLFSIVLASAIDQRPLFPLVLHAGNHSLPIILFVRRPKTHRPMPDHLIVA
jgi:hypothetical protein